MCVLQVKFHRLCILHFDYLGVNDQISLLTVNFVMKSIIANFLSKEVRYIRDGSCDAPGDMTCTTNYNERDTRT